MNSKSQSEITSTILLILLVISAIVIIAGFVFPFVKNELEKSNCFKTINEIEIKNNPSYTCYDAVAHKMRVQIHLGDNELIKGFAIVLGGNSSRNYKVTPDYPDEIGSEISMYPSGNIALPGKNEERIYVIAHGSKPDYIQVYPILENKKMCDSSEVYNQIEDC